MSAEPEMSDEWVPFWRWANSRGYWDWTDIELAIQRPHVGLPASEVRRLVEESERVFSPSPAATPATSANGSEGRGMTPGQITTLLVAVAVIAFMAAAAGARQAGVVATDESAPSYSAPQYSAPVPKEPLIPRSNYIERLEEEGRRRDEERRLRDLEKRQSELERCRNAGPGNLVLGCR